jgi:hypothetical protein
VHLVPQQIDGTRAARRMEPMTTKSKAKADDESAEATADEAAKVEEVSLCGAPHFLPALAHVTCTLPAADPDLPPGTPGHEHRHQDGDALYTWR